MFDSVLAQQLVGVLQEKNGFLLELLFIGVQTMRETDHVAPLITEAEQDKQSARDGVAVRFAAT